MPNVSIWACGSIFQSTPPRREVNEQYVAEKSPLWKASQRNTVDSRWRTWIAPKFANVPVNKVTRAMLQDWVSDMAARRSASLTRTTANILDGILSIAVQDRRIARNPMDGITLPRKPRKKAVRTYLHGKPFPDGIVLGTVWKAGDTF